MRSKNAQMTNQFTDEQIKTAARKWIERLDSDAHWARSPGAREKASSEKKILDGLLEAAAGIAPQAQSGYVYCPIHGDLLAARRSFVCEHAENGHEYSRHTIPLYGMLDLWMALYGTSHPQFDEFYEKHGYAETWARLLAEVRSRAAAPAEPTGAQVEAAAREWYEQANGYETWASASGKHQQVVKVRAAKALVAAAGASPLSSGNHLVDADGCEAGTGVAGAGPQAESAPLREALKTAREHFTAIAGSGEIRVWEDTGEKLGIDHQVSVWAKRGERICRDALAAPVQPSSTVDEAALAGVIANAGRLVPVRQDMPDRDGGAMIAKLAVSRNHATMPNCDGCGRFTSNPDVKRWCEGQGDWHACHERMLCPKCAEKEATDD